MENIFIKNNFFDLCQYITYFGHENINEQTHLKKLILQQSYFMSATHSVMNIIMNVAGTKKKNYLIPFGSKSGKSTIL